MKTHGFSLVELMIVVAMIGILAALGVPVYTGYVNQAARSEANTVMPDILSKQNALRNLAIKDLKDGNSLLGAGKRAPQYCSAASSDWVRLGYNAKCQEKDKQGGIFGIATYFRYNTTTETKTIGSRSVRINSVTAQRRLPGVGNKTKTETATLSSLSPRSIEFNISG